MFSGRHASRGAQAFAVLLALMALPTAGASGEIVGAKGGGPLSPRLEELAAPAIAAQPLAGQARYLGFPVSGPGSLIRDGNRVLVHARFGQGAVAALPDLRQAGARIVSLSARAQTVTLSI